MDDIAIGRDRLGNWIIGSLSDVSTLNYIRSIIQIVQMLNIYYGYY